MPGLIYEPQSRRGFLKTSVLGGAAALFSMTPPRLGAEEGPVGLHLALLSDTHIPGDAANGYRGFSPGDNLRQVVPQVVAAQPEAVLLSGDAARLEGLPEDYAELKKIIEPLTREFPVIIGLGNHDDRANFGKAFPQIPGSRPEVQGKSVAVLEHEAVRVVMLDSLLYVNKVAGFLGREQRAWLASYLDQTGDRPLILVVHHTLGDGDGDLLDADRLFALVEPHPQVKAIFFGHSHVWSLEERQGLHLVNLPAVGYNFRDEDPLGWVEGRFNREGFTLTLHANAGNRAEDGRVVELKYA